jgi:hypothetical protein
MAAYSQIATKRKEKEAARDLSIGASAARGDVKEVRKQVKKWSQE